MLMKQPSNRVSGDDDEDAPIWSKAIKAALDDWYVAKHDHDEEGLKTAARAIIDATTAYHKAGGVPLFAHRPLPPQFVDAELGNVQALPEAHVVRVVDSFIDKFEDGAKSVVGQQVASVLKRGQATALEASVGLGAPQDDERKRMNLLAPNDGRDEASPNSPDARPFEQHEEDTGQDVYRAHANRSTIPTPTPPPAPIVKAYRKYQTPGMGSIDTELKEAEEIAKDADKWVWLTFNALDRDSSFANSSDKRASEFAWAIRYYFAPRAGRAFVVVGAANASKSAARKDRYASFDPDGRRFYFTKEFLTLSPRDKIITIIHEALHATPWVLKREEEIGYDRKGTPKSIIDAHEAELDRIAIEYARKLGLY